MTRVRTVALFSLVLLMASSVQAVSIKFQVRMAYQIETGNFDPGTDFVDIAGTFNGWGVGTAHPND